MMTAVTLGSTVHLINIQTLRFYLADNTQPLQYKDTERFACW
jgi:hypothetical protein